MNTNTGILIGLGLVGILIIASIGNEDQVKNKSIETKDPKIEPKKVQL